MYPNGYRYSNRITPCLKPLYTKRVRWIIPTLLMVTLNATGIYRIHKKLQTRDQYPAETSTQLVKTDDRDSTIKALLPEPENIKTRNDDLHKP